MVSSLSLSPSAMSELAFYSRRLKQEKITRLFSVLAAILVVGLQFATILAPPTPSNAASASDLIHGGITSKKDLLAEYDKSAELRGIFTYMGISRANLVSSDKGTVNSSDHSLNSISRVAHTSSDKTLKINGKTYYYRPLYKADISHTSTYTVFEGKRSLDGGYFAVMFLCGNIIFKKVPVHPTPTPTPKIVTPKPITPQPITPAPVVTPVPATPTPAPVYSITCVSLTAPTTAGQAPLEVTFTATGSASNQSVKEYVFDFGDGSRLQTTAATVNHTYEKIGAQTATVRVVGSRGTITPVSAPCSLTITTRDTPGQIIESKTAFNQTQNVDAQTKAAQPSDIVVYSLTAQNVGGSDIQYMFQDDITDILEYADVVDFGGATMTGNLITWPNQIIKPKAKVTKTFTIKVKNPVPTTATGLSDRFSFDLRMDNLFGNVIQVPIQPPVPKQIEVAASNLPQTGAGSTTVIVLIVAFLAFFFYLRNRQLMAEVKILRHDYQGGR